METEHKNEAKDIIELAQFNIKVSVESIGIEILVTTIDPLDCIVLAGRIIDVLRQEKNLEPKVLILI